jgi:hypothetical protein
MGHEAKALGRMGGADSHFTVEPDTWEFYARDAHRLARDDELAAQHARAVIEKGTGPGGVERSPMRMAEARLALGVAAARTGVLEQAIALGREALFCPRKSLRATHVSYVPSSHGAQNTT